MPHIELLGIIGVMFETISSVTTSKKFDSQTKHAADSQNFKTNEDLQSKLDESRLSKDKANMPDYHNSNRIKTNMPNYFDKCERIHDRCTISTMSYK